VLLAGQDFTGEPVARVHLPVRVPLGFHGNWIGDQSPRSGEGDRRRQRDLDDTELGGEA
jgi:hypothetical protein